jgi:Glycosyl transferase family 2
MISIIIPTLFKCDLLFESLKRFERNLANNDELILIDNTNSSHDFNSGNIRHLKYTTNNFVAKSWNIGVSEAKNDVLIIANDDVVFDYACYKSNIVEFFTNKPNAGLIGANLSNLSRPGHTNVNKSTDVLEFVETPKRIKGFGMLMAIHKQNYVEIPEVLRVFCGDDYLFDKQLVNNRTNYVCSVKMSGYVSYTSKYFQQDYESAKQHYKAMVNQEVSSNDSTLLLSKNKLYV